MFDLGWQEFVLIALVAVVVVGPKDLPRVIRTVGQWIRKARSLASEFQGSLEEMARESELDDVRKSIQQVSKDGLGASIEKHVDPGGDIRRSIDEARESSGADEIGEAFDEAQRDTRAVADATKTAASYEARAAEVRIPDNSVTPPADPSAAPDPRPGPGSAKPKPATTKTRATAATGATGRAASTKAAPAKTAPAKTAPAKAAPAKVAAAKTAPAKTAPAKATRASGKPSASKSAATKSKPAARKPASGDAGEA